MGGGLHSFPSPRTRDTLPSRMSKPKNAAATAASLEAVTLWLSEMLRVGQVPRISDILDRVKREGWKLSRKEVVGLLQKDPIYLFNMHQQKKRLGSRKHRPVVASALGFLHCDIGFFGKSKHYDTPVTFQSGFLAAKDVLSRYVYLVVLKKNRKAASMVSAFNTLLELHRQAGHTHRIRSISFDRERSVVSKEVQKFMETKNIKCTFFKMSKSKAKHAENLIKLVRTDVARLERFHQQQAKKNKLPSSRRWWNLLGEVAEGLNSKPILVGGKRLGFTPRDVAESNLDDFLGALYKAKPAAYAAQFQIAPQFANFRYPVGTEVRAKLISTSSQILGTKHSQTNLEEAVFRIVEAIPYVTSDLSVGQSYRCVDVRSGQQEIFDQYDIVPTNPEVVSSDPHSQQ